MSWLSAMKIVITALISIASASGIIVAVAKLLSERIASHLSQKLLAQNQLKLDKLLAEYQTALDDKSHIRTVHFDNEFAIYQALSSSFFEMVGAAHWLFPSSLDRAPASSNWREICDVRYHMAVDKYNAACAMLGSKAPFIPQDKYDLFNNMLKLSLEQIQAYEFSDPLNIGFDPSVTGIRKEGYERTVTIDKEWDSLLIQLRDYFDTLRECKTHDV